MDDDKAAYLGERLGAALAAEQEALRNVGTALADAQLNFDIASSRFAALRDMAVKRGGWPFGEAPLSRNLTGVYRFIRMDVGEAVVWALREASSPLDLRDLENALTLGGLGAEEGGVNLRAVNAALMKTSNIEKTADGKYVYKPDDLPF